MIASLSVIICSLGIKEISLVSLPFIRPNTTTSISGESKAWTALSKMLGKK